MSDNRLDGLVPPGAAVSALAVDGDGTVLVERNPDRAVAPASNTKLVTTALAFETLNPEFRFETAVYADGTTENGTLDGDLRLVAAGDPSLDLSALRSLAADVARSVSRVTGDLVVDVSVFDGPQYGPGRAWGDARYPYGAPASALSVGGNTVTVAVDGDGSGEFSVSLEPASTAVEAEVDLTVIEGSANDATGDEASDDGDDVVVTGPADAPSGVVRVEGSLPPDGEYKGEAPVQQPVRHAGQIARSALQKAGVRIDGGIVIADETRSDESTGKQLATVRSAPLCEIVREMNVHSDNVVADTLARVVAARETGTGSWEAWADLVAERFDALGIETVRICDGAGLSRYNRLPANGIVALLRWVADTDWGPAFFDSLPAPGEGTLENRLDGVRLAAKTGTLTGVRALSGRVQRNGGPVYFSFLVGDLTVDADTVRDEQDEMVRLLAGQ